ncbi:MAG: hypothetical protein NZT92_21010, partial [Abditibacteriales bacterium]|nr:hypothetical protein [Abditibacteriales bacterium]MDW8368199.1 hypothetical protein [Abditibacteriales bacterium]
SVTPQASPTMPPTLSQPGGYRSAPSRVPQTYPPQALPSPYSLDIKEPAVRQNERGVQVGSQPPSNPSSPTSNNVLKDPRLVMHQDQPQKPSDGGGEKSPDEAAAGQSGGSSQSTATDTAPAGPLHSDVSPEVKTPQPPHVATRGLAKSQESDNATSELSTKSSAEPVTPQKPAPTVSESNPPPAAPSALKSPPLLTLYINRPQQITLHIQPTTDLSQAEVLVTLPPTIDLRGVMRPGLLPYRVYSGPIFSHQPVPITLDLFPRAVGRYTLNVTLRSPSLSRPITQRIPVQVLIGRMGQ